MRQISGKADISITLLRKCDCSVIQWNISVSAPESHWLWISGYSSREQTHTQLLLYLVAYPLIRSKQGCSSRKGACLKHRPEGLLLGLPISGRGAVGGEEGVVNHTAIMLDLHLGVWLQSCPTALHFFRTNPLKQPSGGVNQLPPLSRYQSFPFGNSGEGSFSDPPSQQIPMLSSGEKEGRSFPNPSAFSPSQGMESRRNTESKWRFPFLGGSSSIYWVRLLMGKTHSYSFPRSC